MSADYLGAAMRKRWCSGDVPNSDRFATASEVTDALETADVVAVMEEIYDTDPRVLFQARLSGLGSYDA